MTQIKLTSAQRDQLTAQFAELVADNMDTKDLVRYAISGMIEYFNEGSLDELREEIDTFDEELYDELVDNVTTDTLPIDPKTYTYGLAEGESLSFPVHDS